MSDLIDRQAAIDKIKSLYMGDKDKYERALDDFTEGHRDANIWINGLADAIEAIKEMPSAGAECWVKGGGKNE